MSEGGLEPPQSYLVRALKVALAAKHMTVVHGSLSRVDASLCPKCVHAGPARPAAENGTYMTAPIDPRPGWRTGAHLTQLQTSGMSYADAHRGAYRGPG